MIRKEVEKLRGTTFTEDEMRAVILPILSTSKVCFFKEDFENLSKEELQEKLDELIKYGLVWPDTTLDEVGVYDSLKPRMQPVIYMTKDVQEGILSDIKHGNLVGLAVYLQYIMHGVDDETMKQIQKLVEEK